MSQLETIVHDRFPNEVPSYITDALQAFISPRGRDRFGHVSSEGDLIMLSKDSTAMGKEPNDLNHSGSWTVTINPVRGYLTRENKQYNYGADKFQSPVLTVDMTVIVNPQGTIRWARRSARFSFTTRVGGRSNFEQVWSTKPLDEHSVHLFSETSEKLDKNFPIHQDDMFTARETLSMIALGKRQPVSQRYDPITAFNQSVYKSIFAPFRLKK